MLWEQSHEGSSPSLPTNMSTPKIDKNNLAYIIGVALGDGNLSNPNGRSVRLRISCDTKYPAIINSITIAIKKLLPTNKVSLINTKSNCVDISCYSNKWENFLGWKAKEGSKEKQEIKIPDWIKNNKTYSKYCLRGLFETDRCVYTDRGYPMANFVSIIPTLANDVMEIIYKLGFNPNMQKLKKANGKTKHTLRISKDTEKFIKLIKLNKN